MAGAERKPEFKDTFPEKGKLIVIWGPMFSGKTRETIHLIERSGYADKNAIIFKPELDNRYSTDQVVTHYGEKWVAYNIDEKSPADILLQIEELEKEGGTIDIVAIDEAQFFDSEILPFVVNKILESGKDVIVNGLAADAFDQPFGAMSLLLIRADESRHLTAVCTYHDNDGKVCGRDASKTQRLVDDEGQVLIGGKDAYGARCGQHHKGALVD